jgi:VanZ family protein
MTASHFYRVLTVGWMALIFFLSSQPAPSIPLPFLGGDKLLHVIVYAILGFLFSRALFLDRVMTWKRALLVIGLVMVYGVTDEFHQSLVPGRQVSEWDVLADSLGAAIATGLIRWRAV